MMMRGSDKVLYNKATKNKIRQQSELLHFIPTHNLWRNKQKQSLHFNPKLTKQSPLPVLLLLLILWLVRRIQQCI